MKKRIYQSAKVCYTTEVEKIIDILYCEKYNDLKDKLIVSEQN
jgi:hypothetical protein